MRTNIIVPNLHYRIQIGFLPKHELQVLTCDVIETIISLFTFINK